MPARKPSTLFSGHQPGAERQERANAESMAKPGRALPQNAPAALNGHAVASAVYRRLMRTYGSAQGEIVTAFDMDLLVDVCMLMDQLAQLDGMRKSAHKVYLELQDAWDSAVTEGRLEESIVLSQKVIMAFDAVVKLDARADRKRSLLHTLRQSLYLTPRSRAGAAPKAKEETPADEFEQMLNEFASMQKGEDDAQ